MKNAPVAIRKPERPSTIVKAQLRRDALIADLIETRRKIIDVASSLPPTRQDQVFLGIWSIKDLLAHLIGWLEENRKAVKVIRAGRLPEFYAYKDHDWQTYNAYLVSRYKRGNMTELLSTLQASQQKFIKSIQAVPIEALEQDFGVRFKRYKVTIVRLLQAELKDEKVHCAQMEAFRDKTK